jgi:hypothetical protein
MFRSHLKIVVSRYFFFQIIKYLLPNSEADHQISLVNIKPSRRRKMSNPLIENPIKKGKNTALIATALIFLMTASALFVAMPFASAKDPSWAFISVVPKSAQVDTQVLITGWTTPLGVNSTTAFKTGYVVTLTKPTGEIVNISIAQSYEDSTFFKSYTVDQVGQWSVVLSWPGDGDFNACVSPPFYFNVNQTATYAEVPTVPMPTGYWTRPLYDDIKGMSLYLGSWPQSDYDGGHRRYNPASYAPNTAHTLD